ncbi:hypothetical protein NUSPORA_01903 [Nucleospora cyclopteri]
MINFYLFFIFLYTTLCDNEELDVSLFDELDIFGYKLKRSELERKGIDHIQIHFLCEHYLRYYEKSKRNYTVVNRTVFYDITNHRRFKIRLDYHKRVYGAKKHIYDLVLYVIIALFIQLIFIIKYFDKLIQWAIFME